MKEYTTNGILYTWELAGSEGASFILYPTDNNSKAEINAAKAELRHNHDVIWLRLANEDDRDYLYKGDIFRIPETKPLKWYQIEQDEATIRKARLQGLTPQQFVDTLVLPYIAATEQRYFLQHGQKMYGI